MALDYGLPTDPPPIPLRPYQALCLEMANKLRDAAHELTRVEGILRNSRLDLARPEVIHRTACLEGHRGELLQCSLTVLEVCERIAAMHFKHTVIPFEE